MSRYGFIKVAAAVPRLQVADCTYNVAQMLAQIRQAEKEGVQVLAFPELSITGYTCADLFHQQWLLHQAEKGLGQLLQETGDVDLLFLAGLPVRAGNQIFNAVAVCQRGRILGVVPKIHLPNYSEFYEKRWFSSGAEATQETVRLCGQEVPFGPRLLFRNRSDERLVVAVEICEDLWVVIPPSSYHALAGATLLINASASNELVEKEEYRRALVQQQSARCMAGYIFTSAGLGESTTDLVFSGSAMIAENGRLLAEAQRFSLKEELVCTEIDLEYLQVNRRKNSGFMAPFFQDGKKDYRVIDFSLEEKEPPLPLTRPISPHPFIPANPQTRKERCREILMIQSAGLIKRLQHTGVRKVVVGISGGLDSTLALLVCLRAFDRLGMPREGIIAITMPGFGTTDRTYRNALQLMETLGVSRREISIREACLQHFRDIGVDPSVHDVTYENAQARERTQILMDVANKEGALVIGTGDLSELALGWATYNGDHMSMYAVNVGVPKTLVRHLIAWIAEEWAASPGEKERQAAAVLRDIMDTPISPELIPPDAEGTIRQKTEEIVGNYDLHDFFLYYMIKTGFSPAKIAYLAEHAFAGKYKRKAIIEQMREFYRRFFSQQFKRSCLPDGVKVGSISLSPRGDWRMPSDASARLWLDEVERLAKE